MKNNSNKFGKKMGSMFSSNKKEQLLVLVLGAAISTGLMASVNAVSDFIGDRIEAKRQKKILKDLEEALKKRKHAAISKEDLEDAFAEMAEDLDYDDEDDDSEDVNIPPEVMEYFNMLHKKKN